MHVVVIGSEGTAGEAEEEQAEDMLDPIEQIKANLALGATGRHVASDTHVHLNCYHAGTMATIAWGYSVGNTIRPAIVLVHGCSIADLNSYACTLLCFTHMKASSDALI